MRNKWLILIAVGVADLLGSIDTTGVNIILPKITANFNVSISFSQWIVTAQILAMVSTLMIAGKVCDLIGAKRTYIFGLILFGLSSLAIGFANSFYLILIFRILQGIGTAILYTAPLSIIARLWKNREKAFSVTAMFFSAGLVVGPILGGLFANLHIGNFEGWHLLFLLNIPLVITGIIIAWLKIPKIDSLNKKEGIDYFGTTLLITGLFLLVLGLTNSNLRIFILPAIIALAVMIFTLRFTRNPAFDIKLFKNRNFSSSNIVSFTAMICVSGLSLINTFFLQQKMGFNPFIAGLALLPVPVFMVIFAGIGGYIKNWRLANSLSITLLFTSLVFLAIIKPELSYFKGLLFAYIIAGAGGGLLITAIFTTVLGSAPKEKSGEASGILNTLQSIGSLLGIAIVSGFIINTFVGYLMLASIAVVGIIASLFVNNKERMKYA